MLTRSRKAIWNKHFHELDEYIHTHGVRPPKKSLLFMWFQVNQRNFKKKTYAMSDPELRATWECFLDEHGHIIAPYNFPYEIKAEQLRQYLSEHNEKPKRSTTLGKWCHVQQRKHYTKKLNSDNQLIWEDLLRNFPNQLKLSRFQKWHIMLNQVIKHIEDHNGEVSGVSKYTRWVDLQMRNYERHVDEMSNQVIRRVWETKFLAEVEINRPNDNQ